MSWVDWTTLLLGTVQAVATVIALYFARDAVREARVARQEAARDKRLTHIERMTLAVREIKRTYEFGAKIERRRQVERLQALLQAMPRRALPKTRAFAEREPAPPFSDEEYRKLGDEAITELEDAADEAFGH